LTEIGKKAYSLLFRFVRLLNSRGGMTMRAILLSGIVMVGVVALSVTLSGQPVALAQTDPAQTAKGEKVYGDKKCAVCHAIKGRGSKAGPDLSTVGAKRDANWLKAFLKDPKATNPRSKMMSFKGTDEELETLVAYLVSLK